MTPHACAEISVAIATRDRPELLARLLEALRAGDLHPREVVVVDQSGDDRSERISRERASGNLEIRYVRDYGKGLASAQNRAFSHAQCPVIAVTDDDCVPAADWLAVMENRFSAERELGALTGPVFPLPADDADLVPVSTRTSPLVRTFSGRHVPWEVGSGNNFAVRREWLEIVRGNDERLGPGASGQGGVDMDLFYRLLRSGARIRYDPACLVQHAKATKEERLARRAPYGHGIGADVAIWLRRGDLSRSGFSRGGSRCAFAASALAYVAATGRSLTRRRSFSGGRPEACSSASVRGENALRPTGGRLPRRNEAVVEPLEQGRGSVPGQMLTGPRVRGLADR